MKFGRNMQRRSLRQKLAGNPETAAVLGLVAVPFVLFVACVVAWFTHVLVCLAAGKWGFLIAGALMFPIAIIHGVMIWFGYGL